MAQAAFPAAAAAGTSLPGVALITYLFGEDMQKPGEAEVC